MMISVFRFAFLLLCFTSCQDQGQDIEFLPQPIDVIPVIESNDMENVSLMPYSWVNDRTVNKMPVGRAHSGKFVSIVDSIDKASYGFKEKFGNIVSFSPDIIEVNGWVYTPQANDKLQIILSITLNNESELYLSYNLNSQPLVLNQWNPFSARFTMKNQISKDHTLFIYAFGNGKTAYFDDFSIAFK
jgi:hypothetical protein